ncbi:MarR family transcriptional regulator [Salinisphaera sp. SPP-AMP-43]|uniref:MarR family winged helix-turn-helix transcriptional regulator n=1 Tax=Salinisphaera sp. SPP-AMP-43 TaxID=3121288 RepID=UPI003C6E3A58
MTSTNQTPATTSTIDTLDDSALRGFVGYQLKRADLIMQQTFAREVGEPFGLRQTEFSVLVLLSANDSVKHKQISAALGVAPSNMVGVMSALEKRKLVTRRQDPTDGRSSFWQLTDAGRELERRASAAVRRMENNHVADETESHRGELVEALDRLWGSDEIEASGSS